MTRRHAVNRAATERLCELIRAELARQNLTAEEAAREARLPSGAFRALIRGGHRPTIDRADELCRALGISMMIGASPPSASNGRDDKTNHQP